MKHTSRRFFSVMTVAALVCGLWTGCKKDEGGQPPPPPDGGNADDPANSPGNVGAGNVPDWNLGNASVLLLRAADAPALEGKMQHVSTGADGVELPVAEQYVLVKDKSIPKAAEPKVHRATWQVDLPADDAYNVWVYAWWFDSCANSVYLGIDSGGAEVLPDQKMGDDGVVKKWHWVPLRVPLKLKAGAGKVVLKCREDGARVGAILLTTKSSIPQGPEG